MNTKLLTKEQVNKRYKGKYIEVHCIFDHADQKVMYEVRRVFTHIHENTTLGEDVGTNLAYRR